MASFGHNVLIKVHITPKTCPNSQMLALTVIAVDLDGQNPCFVPWIVVLQSKMDAPTAL